MDTKGRHLLVEYYGCDANVLNDPQSIERLMRQAASAAGATVVGSIFHPFTPQGVSGVVVVEESHLSIHTWPERGYAAVDFYTCGNCRPELAHEVLHAGLRPSRAECMFIRRGQRDSVRSMSIEQRLDNAGPQIESAHGSAARQLRESPHRPNQDASTVTA